MSEHTPESYVRGALDAIRAENYDDARAHLESALERMSGEETRPLSALTEGDRKNFDTLRAAVANEDVALVYTTEKATGRSAALICAMNYVEGEYEAVPLARLVDGDPYELFTDPTEEHDA